MADSNERKKGRLRKQHTSSPDVTMQVIRSLWRNKLWILLLMIVAAVAFSWHSVRESKKTASASLVLLYEQAYEGLNPNGTRFNIYDLLSEEVLDRTIERAGLSGELNRDDLLDSLEIRASGSKNPKDMYIATEYSVSLNGAILPRRISADSMLNLLMETYKQYFLDHYGTNDSILNIDWSDAENWEYLEFASVVDLKVNNLITYLDGLRTESGMSQYRLSGESFRSLSESISSFRDIYLDRFTSYVTVNRLFRNPDSYHSKLEYQRFLTEQSMKNNQNLYAIRQDALNMYDESMITFVMVPMYDSSSGLYMARTAIGMDSLTEQSESFVEAVETSSKELKELKARIEDIQNAESDPEKHETAEQMMTEIRQHLDDLIDRIRVVKNDYEDYRSRTSIRYALKQPGLISAYNLKGAAAVSLAVFLLIAIVFAVRTSLRQRHALRRDAL